ncbi:PCRF domain-containing protein [Roseibium salinum]|nr:PCRF domain-containing protein [Roseibium salinum]
MEELNALSEDPELWNDPTKAQKLMRERQQLDDGISGVKELERDLSDNVELIELGEMEDDKSVVAEAEQALRGLRDKVTQLQLKSLLSGEADANDTYLEINSGAGGTESQDWASMLLRMYRRWAEKHGFKVELLEYHDGEEAGIKSATLLVKGEKCLWVAEDRIRRSPPGTHFAV